MSAYGCLLGGAVGEAVFSSVSKIGLCSWGPGQALCPQAGAIVCAPSVPCHCSLWRHLSFPSFSPICLVWLVHWGQHPQSLVKERREGTRAAQVLTSLTPHCEVRGWGLFSPFFLLSCLWWGLFSASFTSLIQPGLAVYPRVIPLAPPTLPRDDNANCVWMLRKVVPSWLQGAHVHA